jgi:protocatechuate 3,4-dioxygenase, beta subunit
MKQTSTKELTKTITAASDGSLYLTTPNAPKAEPFWQAKDQFDAASFYDTILTFGRDAAGAVRSVTFRSRDGKELTGTRA